MGSSFAPLWAAAAVTEAVPWPLLAMLTTLVVLASASSAYYYMYLGIPPLPPPRAPGSATAVGIDIGGVIISMVGKELRKSSVEDTSMMEAFLDTPPVPGSFDGVRRCVEAHGAANVYIVSYAGRVMEQKSRQWLEHHYFFRKTGMLPRNVVVCRLTGQKAPICESLGITHFIDDHQRILQPMIPLQQSGVMERLVLLNSHREKVRFPKAVTEVHTWQEALTHLLQPPRTAVGGAGAPGDEKTAQGDLNKNKKNA
jgi:hypothetical protein